jgi:hypothetical protein
MAGPEGPSSLRDDAPRFWRLVRRRLVNAAEDDRPFAACSELALRVTGQDSIAALHRLPAPQFAEWGRSYGKLEQLSTLKAALPDLLSLHRRSWPLSRRPLRELMRPSAGSPEAVHPSEPEPGTPVAGLHLQGAAYRASRVSPRGWMLVLSEPGRVRGLRSTDQGKNWTATSPWQPLLDGFADRCTTAEAQSRFSLGRAPGSGSTELVTEFGQGEKWVTRAVTGDETPTALGCDDTGFVMTTWAPSSQKTSLVRCRLRAACEKLTVPSLPPGLRIPMDVARVQGTIVLALLEGDVVRTLSSRDEGRTWTPPTVAFDRQESALAPSSSPLGVGLMPFGSVLLLLVELPSRAQAVGLLSQDLGASWHGL